MTEALQDFTLNVFLAETPGNNIAADLAYNQSYRAWGSFWGNTKIRLRSVYANAIRVCCRKAKVIDCKFNCDARASYKVSNQVADPTNAFPLWPRDSPNIQTR